MKKEIKTVRFPLNHTVFKWIAAGVGGFFCVIILAYCYIAWLLPIPDVLTKPVDLPTTKIFDRKGTLLYEILQPEQGKKTNIPLKRIPADFINATLAAEDINFYSHPGVDIGAIARSLLFNVMEQRVVSGASTITQQLIRNLTGNLNKRDFHEKMVEAAYAIRISNMYDKDTILEMYLNRIYYGNMAYGAESAALDYFGRHIYDLDLAQCAFIAGLPQSPSSYNPFVYFDNAKKRQKYVLGQMVKYGLITKNKAESAEKENLSMRPNKYQIKAPHFVQMVIGQLEEKYGENRVINGGLSVITTLDYDLQLKAEQIIKRHVDRLASNNVTNGAMVALDPSNGQILVWVGSYDYFDEKIDGAVDMVTALRQPGSSIKPLTYLAAFEKGYTPATVIYDIPTQFNTESGAYSPKNYDLDYHGPVRVRIALASSFNIPAVKTLEYVGVGSFISFLSKLGINTLEAEPSFYGLALTLGGGEVRLIDMAGAYDVIANYGIKRDSAAIMEVTDSQGNVIEKYHKENGKYVLGNHGREHSYQIIDIMKDPSARIAGFGEGSVLELSHQAAVKTGTTRNFRDNLTIGFTPRLLTAVWVGNADASPMENVTGVDGAAPVWADFMESALEMKPKIDFFRPVNLIQKEICAISGKLPTELCKEKIYEWFVKGDEPKLFDDYYKLFGVDNVSGKIFDDSCKKDYYRLNLKETALIAYPAELQRWALSKGLQLPQINSCNTPREYSATTPVTTQTPGAPYLSKQNDSPVVYTEAYADVQAKRFILDSPANGDEYMIESTLPLKDQKIPFRSTPPLGTTKVTYRIDGTETETVEKPPFSYLWLPEKGMHNIDAFAILNDGRKIKSSGSTFIVK